MKTNTIIFSFIALMLFNTPSIEAQDFSKKLQKYTDAIVGEFDQIGQDRKKQLKEIEGAISTQLQTNSQAALMVICTHNSRRSHMAQVWLSTAALYYGVGGLHVFSGGLEATAFNPNAISALERAGFSISGGVPKDNPRYTVTAGSNQMVHYSKKYTDAQNPSEGFIAVMVCSDADKSCPIVHGANARFALPYDDPRYSDGTPSQDGTYDETVRLIGREMFFLIDHLKKQQNLKMEATK